MRLMIWFRRHRNDEIAVCVSRRYFSVEGTSFTMVRSRTLTSNNLVSVPADSWTERTVWYTAATVGCGLVVVTTVPFVDSVYYSGIGRVGFMATSLLVFCGAVWLGSTRLAPAVHGFTLGLALVTAGTTIFGLADLLLGHTMRGLFGLGVVIVLAGFCGLYPLLNGHNPVYVVVFGLVPLAALGYGLTYVVHWVIGFELWVQLLASAAATLPFVAVFGVLYATIEFLSLRVPE